MILPLQVAPLPVRQLVEALPAHLEDQIEVGVGQVAFQVVAVDVDGQPVVGRRQEVQRIDRR